MSETVNQPMLTSRFTEAVAYARIIHRDQVRKRSTSEDPEVPYLAHVLSTAALVLEDGGSEDEAIAALFHDALEDQSERTSYQEIADLFGSEVARIVEECSDRAPGEELDWRSRKERYLEGIPKKSPEAARVSIADKLDNARSILRDYRVLGDALWDRFNAAKEDQLWYYRSLTDALGRAHPGPMSRELERVVDELETLAP